MKKTLTAVSIVLALVLCLGIALAVGGDANDPLLSLSYLQNIFRPKVDEDIDLALNTSDELIREETQKMLDDMIESTGNAAGQDFAPVVQEMTLNQYDSLSGTTGLSVTALAGEIVVNISLGSVIDVTTGEEILSGTTLTDKHRYIVAENSFADFTASSATATLTYQGHYSYVPSNFSTDYYGIALALRELGLFRGNGSSIGNGFDLHVAPTRAEALVMFIRILGEENDALACTYKHPFTDVPAWLDRYVAWAWYNGYTNGIGNNKFGSTLTVSSMEYQEFILRALGYSVAGVDDYRTSLERAREYGILTDAEYFLLMDYKFLRAHVAYLSYYNLDTGIAGSHITLAQRLQQQGVFTFQQLIIAREYVSSPRMH